MNGNVCPATLKIVEKVETTTLVRVIEGKKHEAHGSIWVRGYFDDLRIEVFRCKNCGCYFREEE